MDQKAREVRRLDPLAVVLSLLFHQPTGGRAGRDGGNGERFPALIIGKLPQGWLAFHDVPTGERGAHIAHVIVGPAGTFTLSTKDLTGKIWVDARSVRHNGHPTDFLSKATHEAWLASRSLSTAVGRQVGVRGVVAILADGWTIRERPKDVHVASPRGVKDWLLRLPTMLAPTEVMEIAAAVNEPSTWTTTDSHADHRT